MQDILNSLTKMSIQNATSIMYYNGAFIPFIKSIYIFTFIFVMNTILKGSHLYKDVQYTNHNAKQIQL